MCHSLQQNINRVSRRNFCFYVTLPFRKDSSQPCPEIHELLKSIPYQCIRFHISSIWDRGKCCSLPSGFRIYLARKSYVRTSTKHGIRARRKHASGVPGRDSPQRSEGAQRLQAAAFCRLIFPTSLRGCLFLHGQKVKAHSFWP